MAPCDSAVKRALLERMAERLDQELLADWRSQR